jgi:hypothetical protein
MAYVALATYISVHLWQSGDTPAQTTGSGDRMVAENVRRHWSENRLLAAVPAIDRAMLEPHAEFVQLAQGQVLFEPEEDVLTTHFPLTESNAPCRVEERY